MRLFKYWVTLKAGRLYWICLRQSSVGESELYPITDLCDRLAITAGKYWRSVGRIVIRSPGSRRESYARTGIWSIGGIAGVTLVFKSMLISPFNQKYATGTVHTFTTLMNACFCPSELRCDHHLTEPITPPEICGVRCLTAVPR